MYFKKIITNSKPTQKDIPTKREVKDCFLGMYQVVLHYNQPMTNDKILQKN